MTRFPLTTSAPEHSTDKARNITSAVLLADLVGMLSTLLAGRRALSE